MLGVITLSDYAHSGSVRSFVPWLYSLDPLNPMCQCPGKIMPGMIVKPSAFGHRKQHEDSASLLSAGERVKKKQIQAEA